MKARLRELLRVRPFQSLIIRMAGGREYRIEHPDFVLASSTEGTQVILEELDGRMHYLSVLLIASVEQAPETVSM